MYEDIFLLEFVKSRTESISNGRVSFHVHCLFSSRRQAELTPVQAYCSYYNVSWFLIFWLKFFHNISKCNVTRFLKSSKLINEFLTPTLRNYRSHEILL